MNKFGIAAVLVAVAFAGRVNAGFEFTITGGNYLASEAGTTVTEDLFLVATGTDSLDSITGVRYSISPTSGDSTVQAYAIENPPYDGFSNNVTLVGGGAEVAQNANSPASPLIRLGQVSFLLGAAGTTTDFALNTGSPDTPTDIFAAFNGGATASGDALFTPTTHSLTVAAVPEPGALGIICLSGVVVSLRRRRKQA